ncbi:hypothetical protein ACUTAF_25060 [Pseudomonas sp. SP16.1]|uniref:hypothetical protein n=1 Tax=Pseudomonas sp. SP16.1 TaxID=3458854 RepID=UPI0040455B86
MLLDWDLGDNLFSRLRSNRLKRRGSRRGHVISETRQIEIFVRHIKRFLGFQLQGPLGPALVALDSGRLRGFAEGAIRARAHQQHRRASTILQECLRQLLQPSRRRGLISNRRKVDSQDRPVKEVALLASQLKQGLLGLFSSAQRNEKELPRCVTPHLKRGAIGLNVQPPDRFHCTTPYTTCRQTSI